ncbi:GGDEF domain-containing protein, partial [Pseudoalteromonas sp. Angola-31]|nr:GGDEF domain-containing protein [Pseudoalteromonas sp. Angola-31]
IVVTQSANSEYLNLKLNKADSQSLLITAYKRLKAMSEGPLLCASIEGGKLGFIIGSSSSEQQNKLLIQIKSTLDQAYDVFGTNYQQSFLFGFAKCPEHGENSAIILSNACEALKLADYNSPFNGYNQKQSQAFMEKYEISMLLDEALQQNDLSV